MRLAGLLWCAVLLQIFERLVQLDAAKSNVEMIFEDCSCKSTDPRGVMKALNCSLGKSSKRRTINVDTIFSRDVAAFNMNLVIVLPRRSENFVLLNRTNFDGCELIANINQVPLVRLVRLNLAHYSNFPSRCPLRGGKAYYIRNFRVDMELLPAFSFETTMNVWFDVLVNSNKVIQGFLNANVSVKHGRNIQSNLN